MPFLGIPSYQMNFPNEIILNILFYVDDFDLQTMRKVNRTFRALASDSILYLHQKYNKELKINYKLSKRPEIDYLVNFNIIKCGNPQNLQVLIESGNYSSLLLNRQSNLDYLLKLHRNQRILTNLFNTRKTSKDLLLPLKFTASPNLQPKALTLTNIFKKQKLNGLLKEMIENRPKPRNVSGNLIPIQNVLTRKLIRKELFRSLRTRCDFQEFCHLNIVPGAVLAFMICPDINTKIQFFESIN
jgi:hypothetical protein